MPLSDQNDYLWINDGSEEEEEDRDVVVEGEEERVVGQHHGIPDILEWI